MFQFTRFATCVLLCSCLPVPAAAQRQQLFEHAIRIDDAKGLPSNDVRSVGKDPEGFMWIGTTNGLCRYDGAQVRVYREDPKDSTSISGNQVLAIQPYRGRIWVGTNLGLSVLDPGTQQFTHIQLDTPGIRQSQVRDPRAVVDVLFADSHGDLWIGTGGYGLVRYRPGTKDFQYFPLQSFVAQPPAASLEWSMRILSITASAANDSIIYAGTATGLQEVNRYTGRVRWYEFPKPNRTEHISVNAFRRIYGHDDGLLYAGSWRAGVHVFDPVRKTFEPLPVKPGPHNRLLESGIRGFQRKSRDEIWITTGFGLLLYHTGRHEITGWKYNDLENEQFYGVDYVDERGRAWACFPNGLYVFDPCLQQFAAYPYDQLKPPGWSFAYYLAQGRSENELLMLPRSDYGLYHFDLQAKTWQRFPLQVPDLHEPIKLPAMGLCKAPDGAYTISMERGLFTYNAETHRMRPLGFRPPLQYFRYGEIHWDYRGRLWICTDVQGLFCWDPVRGTTRVFRKEFLADAKNAFSIAVVRVFEDRKHQLWIRRTNGFSVYLPERDTMYNLLEAQTPGASFNVINGFAEDREGRIWMADNTGWVGYAESSHPERGIVRKFNFFSGNNLDYIFALAADPHGDVWGCTEKELVRIDAGTLQAETFSFRYGGGNNEFFSMKFLPDSSLALGGRNKLVLFNPGGVHLNTEIPKPYLDQVQVQGKTLPGIPLVNGKPGLHLRYWENFVAFEFSAMAYTMGEACRFRYRLKGFDSWTTPGDRRFVNYTNVPGGDYVFQVQVANNEGQWSNITLEFPVWVDTAWWATWWFGLSVVALGLSIVYMIYRFRVLRIRQQAQLRTDFEQKLAHVEMSALLAQMNPHFLFNSLNSIDSYIIRNESKKASEYLNNFARLMRLILNNSRSNYINLNDELEVLELYLQMEALRLRDKFQYEIKTEENLDTASIQIPPMLIQPYLENAIWHGLMHKENGQGKLSVRLTRPGNSLIFIVEDNGVGRVRAAELRSRHSERGRPSMGMQITEDRIEIINKLYDANTSVQIIDLHDESGTPCGTRVILTIPI